MKCFRNPVTRIIPKAMVCKVVMTLLFNESRDAICICLASLSGDDTHVRKSIWFNGNFMGETGNNT